MRSLLAFVLIATATAGAETSLSRGEAVELRTKLTAEQLAKLKTERAGEVEAKSISLGDKKLKWLEKDFSLAPEGKRSLWISMHGGGGAPAAVNDQQWQNQIRLYQPKEGIYLAPRAPTDSWNLWHEAHIDPLFARLIDDMVATRGVDPNKVYLMGYSAGGDGVWQLGPRMADRFAAASMMAGHPNGVSLLGLRNLPFAMFVGGKDAAYDRNTIVPKKAEELDALQKADPEGYEHELHVYPELPHWMNGKDAIAVPWMAKHTRNPWPKKIVWEQTSVPHEHFYWLQVPADQASKMKKVVATVTDNTISLEGDVPHGITLNLADPLVDLDKPVTVKINGKQVFEAVVPRTEAAISAGLEEIPDGSRAPFAKLRLDDGW